MTAIRRATAKRLARRIVSSIAFLSGYCHLAQTCGRGSRARILCYHGINNRPSNSFAVSTDDFERQMRLVAERYHPMSVEALTCLISERKPISPGTVAVTIDDGYEDAYAYAYPILSKFGIPATLFLPTDFIGLSGSSGTLSRLPQDSFMSWAQVREMSQNGMDFGSHTLSHGALAKLTYAEARYQLERSRATLEGQINKPVKGFSYPYGRYCDFNPALAQLVAIAGYSWAVSGVYGANDHHSNIFALRRIAMASGDGMYVFEKALVGALDAWIVIDWLRGLLETR